MEYKKCRQSAKRVISSAKVKKQKECASDLNDPDHQNEIFRMAKQMVNERRDITGSNLFHSYHRHYTVDVLAPKSNSKLSAPLWWKTVCNKSSAVAEMGNGLATTDMGLKVTGLLCPFLLVEPSPHLTQCQLG